MPWVGKRGSSSSTRLSHSHSSHEESTELTGDSAPGLFFMRRNVGDSAPPGILAISDYWYPFFVTACMNITCDALGWEGCTWM